MSSKEYLLTASRALKETSERHIQINELGAYLSSVLGSGGKLLIFGNGGSAADAQHFATELTGRFEEDRRPLPAIALTTDSSALTAIGNDFSFARIFARQITALAQRGDVAIGISTSGKSRNVLRGLETACLSGCYTVLLTGHDALPNTYVDCLIRAASSRTSHIQECHIAIIHALCEIIDGNVARQ